MKHPSNLITAEVRTRIRSMILASEIKPGQRLVEDELAAHLDVGRTPVREALLLLQGEGLIARNRGWEVQGVEHLQVHTIFESRAAIEAATARLAARRVTQDDCDALERLVDAMDRSGNDRRELNRINTEFHQRIVTLSGNDILIEFHQRTQFYYWALRVPVLFSDDQLAESNREHHVLLTALRKGNEDLAEQLARAHVERTMSIVEPALPG